MKNILAIAGILFLCLANEGRADSFGLDATIKGDSVVFQSSARLEFIKGKSYTIKGGFEFNPANPGETISGIIKVDLRLLHSNIETRDEHMREEHLETDKFPFAFFELTSMAEMPEQLDSGKAYNVTANGWFYIHGVKKEISPEINFEYRPPAAGQPASLAVHAKFDIRLDDYRIDRPKALFLKLAETIKLDIQLTGYNSKPIPQISLPDWPALE